MYIYECILLPFKPQRHKPTSREVKGSLHSEILTVNASRRPRRAMELLDILLRPCNIICTKTSMGIYHIHASKDANNNTHTHTHTRKLTIAALEMSFAVNLSLVSRSLLVIIFSVSRTSVILSSIFLIPFSTELIDAAL